MGLSRQVESGFRLGGKKLDVGLGHSNCCGKPSPARCPSSTWWRDKRSGNIVGLKIADPEKTDAFESRFKGLGKPSEGEIAGALKHPHIVQTLEHGLTTKGLRYVVMEYLPGSGLHTLIHTRDPLLDGKRVDLIRQMAEALDCVHRAEFIHRDICPRNFICCPDASSLKLIDFGLTLPASKNFMQPGNRTGTPIYMAPEISRRRPTDQRVDLFSLGVSAYHLCTFDLPWPVGQNPAVSALRYDTDPPRTFSKRVPISTPNWQPRSCCA